MTLGATLLFHGRSSRNRNQVSRPDLRALEKKLRDLASTARLLPPRSQHPVRSARQKLRKGELLRLRDYGGKWKLTHKQSARRRYKSWRARDWRIRRTHDGRILHALGFSPSFVYEKFRSEWSDDVGQVVLDHTPIGNVAEIEGKSRWIDRTLAPWSRQQRLHHEIVC